MKGRAKAKSLQGTTTTESHDRQPSFRQQPRRHKVTAKFKIPPNAKANKIPPEAG
jgi:hypothetical protein